MRRLLLGLLALLWAGGALFGSPNPPHFWWERVPGYAALLGLGGAWLLGAGFRALGERWLQREECYYEERNFAARLDTPRPLAPPGNQRPDRGQNHDG